MVCIFHKWKAVKAYQYIDTSYSSEVDSTHVTLKCIKCGKLRTQILIGFINLEELNR